MKTLLKNYEAIHQAQERYKQFTADEETRLAYQARMKFLRDQANFEAAARHE